MRSALYVYNPKETRIIFSLLLMLSFLQCFFLLLDLNDASKSRYSTIMSALPVNAEVFGSGNQSEESLLKGEELAWLASDSE